MINGQQPSDGLNLANSNIRKNNLKNNFLFSKVFLALIALLLVTLSIYIWKTQEQKSLEHLVLQTESNALAYSNEAEIRYRGIYNALNRLANQGVPNSVQEPGEWGVTAMFYINSFTGIKSIAWIDSNYVIRLIEPIEGNKKYINKKANAVVPELSDISLLVPVYRGSELMGFILGTVSLDLFVLPIINEIKNDYMLELSDQGKTVFTSENWIQPNPNFVTLHTIDLENTAVLNLAFAPTQDQITSENYKSRNILFLCLLFTVMMLVAIHFAQDSYQLSKLNESRYRELLEDAQLVAVILDGSGRVTFCNEMLLNLTGWNREEVVGQDWFERFVPTGWEQVKEMFVTAMASGMIPAQNENPILTRTGEQHWVNFNNTILRDTNGRCIGTASIGEDITDRKKANEALDASEIRYRSLFEAARDGVLILDAETGMIEDVNPYLIEMLGYSLRHNRRGIGQL